MCQRLYIASHSRLPTLRASRRAPFLAVTPLEPESEARRWFSSNVTNVAEARGHVECGCGFPEVNDARPHQVVPREDAETVKALATYLGGLTKRKYLAEVVLSGIGLDVEPQAIGREISLADLRTPGFRFRPGEILRVHARPVGE